MCLIILQTFCNICKTFQNFAKPFLDLFFLSLVGQRKQRYALHRPERYAIVHAAILRHYYTNKLSICYYDPQLICDEYRINTL